MYLFSVSFPRSPHLERHWLCPLLSYNTLLNSLSFNFLVFIFSNLKKGHSLILLTSFLLEILISHLTLLALLLPFKMLHSFSLWLSTCHTSKFKYPLTFFLQLYFFYTLPRQVTHTQLEQLPPLNNSLMYISSFPHLYVLTTEVPGLHQSLIVIQLLNPVVLVPQWFSLPISLSSPTATSAIWEQILFLYWAVG